MRGYAGGVTKVEIMPGCMFCCFFCSQSLLYFTDKETSALPIAFIMIPQGDATANTATTTAIAATRTVNEGSRAGGMVIGGGWERERGAGAGARRKLAVGSACELVRGCWVVL